MAPKRKAAGRPKTTTTAPAKSAPPIPATVTTKGGREIETTAALARPRRAVAAPTPAVKATPSVKKVATMKATAATKKGVSRPVKAAKPLVKQTLAVRSKTKSVPATTATTARKPGRPKKSEPEVESESESESQPTAPAPATKKRGRPAKAKPAAEAPAPATNKRGRSAKDEAEAESEADVEQPVTKKARGRTVKEISIPAATEPTSAHSNGSGFGPAVPPAITGPAPPKKRGRPPKGGETTKISADDKTAADQLEDELVDTADNETGKNFWLLKAEQEDRFETTKSGNKVNTKFTIDDLRAKDGPEAWEGIRNPQARNNLRAMKVGDEAFFYASNGKKPGIVGIMEIVKAHEADPTAFDEDSPYFEAKNPGTIEDPKWSLVHVEFRKKLSVPVYLPELKQYTKSNGPLSAMQMLTAARLSVSKVSEKEWEFIVNDLIEGYEDEDGFDAATVGGAEEEALQAGDSGGVTGGRLPAPTFAMDVDMPSTDTVFPADTMPTSRAPSRAASRNTSRARSALPDASHPPAAAAYPSTELGSETGPKLAGGLAPGGRAVSRGRGRTPRSRAGSAAPPGGAGGGGAMEVVQEEETIVEKTVTTFA